MSLVNHLQIIVRQLSLKQSEEITNKITALDLTFKKYNTETNEYLNNIKGSIQRR